MGWLTFVMPSSASRSLRTTEVRGLPCIELCCLNGRRYYVPLRLPPHWLGFRPFRLIPSRATATIDLIAGAGGPPQLKNQPCMHATSHTPVRFRGDPGSWLRTSAFAHVSLARTARSLTGLSFRRGDLSGVSRAQQREDQPVRESCTQSSRQ